MNDIDDMHLVQVDLLVQIAQVNARVRRLHWWLLSQTILLLALTMTVWRVFV